MKAFFQLCLSVCACGCILLLAYLRVYSRRVLELEKFPASAFICGLILLCVGSAPAVQRAALVFDSVPMAATPFGEIQLAPFKLVAVPVVKKAVFECAGNYQRFEVEESTDLVHWHAVGVYHNDYIRTGHFEIPFFTNQPFAAHRIKAVYYP